MKYPLTAFCLASALVFPACSKKPDGPSTSLTDSEVAEVVEYLRYIRSADTAEGLEHRYTSTSLRHLAKALDGVSRKSGLSDGQVVSKLDSLMVMADSLQANPQSERHPGHIRAAFLRATEMLESLQGARFPGNRDAVSAVRNAAETISPDQSALDQKPRIIAFFDKSGIALSAVARQ